MSPVDIDALFKQSIKLQLDPYVCRFCEESMEVKPLETGLDGEPMPQEVHCSETCRDADLVRLSLAPAPDLSSYNAASRASVARAFRSPFRRKTFDPHHAKPVESWDPEDFG